MALKTDPLKNGFADERRLKKVENTSFQSQ